MNFPLVLYTTYYSIDQFFLKITSSTQENMKVHDLDLAFTSKRTLSIIPKFMTFDLRQSQNNKENDGADIPSTKKYISGSEKQKQQYEPDETEKFLEETQNRLVSSARHLEDFCRNKLMYKSTKQNLDYSVLSKEIRATKQKLKNKHQQKKPSKNNNDQYDSLKEKVSDRKQKLNLLQKALSQQQLTNFEQLLLQKQRKISRQYHDNPQMRQKLVKYYHNYQIISRFLQQVAKDTQKLHIKKENIYLYYNMKNQMVSLLSNQDFFTHHIELIEKSELKRDKTLLTKTSYQQERFFKTFTKHKHTSPTPEFLMIQKIQQLLQTSKANIKDAFAKFNRPDLIYEIQLQFNKRLNQPIQ